MNSRLLISSIAAALALASSSAWAGAHTGGDDAKMDHSAHSDDGMDHSAHMGHSTERDEKGRRLYGMKHNVTPEVADELRGRIPLFQGYSDAEIAMSMEMMGSNYEWFISEPDKRGEQGLLILMHGFRERGDEAFRQAMQPMADIFPTVMSPGMSMMMSDHIQLGIEDLEAAGAETIVVVPIVSTEHNTMMRQWEYIFGMREDPSYAKVPQVKTDARVLMVPPPGDDPLVAEILLDHATEISTDPAKELVIIAAHGPSFEADNQKELVQLENLAKIMREDGDFANVIGVTLQDDAEPRIREANVKALRAKVEKAQADEQSVLIVTNLIGSRTIQAKLRKDLKGLDYKFNNKGITQHDNFMKWMGEGVREQLESVETAQAN